ncbi:hypothetical protein P152DRAFT_434802 [Eremomyces bilateralis CBS 781.70]|uniref:Geranylgeranyl pyrophosphate synthetase n=1 Tax=Eremomyces bilateralis CBS 781.70 TaxID=1392243 RepID=A0A6G1G6P9_9PEZI|nr:uncharacterized protein P152DRAFT_434802 [Eremomyces bilateralis CBS 781.70]KAF1813560.1 hypothetical protein P152DRAFT_434802 [Eremomyces bilateralis CBS 781.70]
MASNTIETEISRLDLQAPSTLSASITDVKHISSYNWIEAPKSTPTIAVPGSPALWSVPRATRQLNKDSGLIYIAQNAARHPDSPLEPLFRSLYMTSPSFDICSIDVVSDRNNIRKLLSFVSSGPGGIEAFTIKVEIVKDTAIFCRDETATYEFIGPHKFRGYGHEFEKAYTTSQVSGSTGHHRIISYRFSDLNVIIRHETDGYVGTRTTTFSATRKEQGIDSLSSALGSLVLSTANNRPVKTNLIVKETGQAVPLESTLEIKTRVAHKPLTIQEVAPQLWVSQTPKLVRAYHRNGIFERPDVEDVTVQIKSWEQQNQGHLRKLAVLIRRIIDAVKAVGGQGVLRYDALRDRLVVSKMDEKKMLPEDLYLKWDDPQPNLDASNVGPSEAKTAQTSLSQLTGKSLEPESNKEASKTKIRIGGVVYSLDVSKIQYLASFVRLQKASDPNSTELVHHGIPLFDIAVKGTESGYRSCFRSLPPEVSQYRTLCETYKFLNVDVLDGLSLNEIISNLKVGRTDYSYDEPVKGNMRLARDAGFQLLYLLLVGQLEDEMKNRNQLFNAVQFVVSHLRTFKYTTRQMVRAAYEARFRLSPKQRAGLNQWQDKGINDPDADTTPDEESGDYYDSFDSDDSF